MHDYANISKRTIQYHQEIKKSKKQIEAITIALIGAAATGEKVSALKYDEDAFSKLDLKEHINVFKESKKNVYELEDYLLEKHSEITKNAIYFRSENSQVKQHLKMCPNNFFNTFFSIDMNTIQKMETNGLFEDFKKYTKINKIPYSIIENITKENYISIFYKEKESLALIQRFFKENNIELDFNEDKFILNKENEEYISYLYIF